MTTWIGHQTKTFIFGFSNFISLPKILYILPFFCSKMFWYWHFLIVASIFKLLYVVKMGPVFTNTSFLHLRKKHRKFLSLGHFYSKTYLIFYASYNYKMIHHNQSHANMHCHCVVIAFYLGGFSHFARVCERMCCEKSFKNINICRYPPKWIDARSELADTTQVAGSPLVQQLFFLPRYVPAIIWQNHTKKERFHCKTFCSFWLNLVLIG